MLRFATASLVPVGLLALAALHGGSVAASWAALGYVTVFVAVMDRVAVAPVPSRNDKAAERAGRGLAAALAGAHFLLMMLVVRAVSRDMDVLTGVATVLAWGLFIGQIAHPVAHEMIHEPARWRRRLGAAIYASMLFGHHVSAHLKVHHVHAATTDDPNSAPAGEGFWHFLPRAWAGSFRAGLAADSAALARSGRPAWRHPFVGYFAGAVLAVVAAAAMGGPLGVAVFMAAVGYAQVQILLADYVQHYGLRRRVRADGRREPVGPAHTWNAPHWYSSAMMLNATRHSDHHLHPHRRFPALRLDPARMPVLPRPLPVMAVIALVPPLWRRVMDPRAAAWAAEPAGVGDGAVATVAPRRNF